MRATFTSVFGAQIPFTRFNSMWAAVRLASSIRRQRRQLLALDRHQLLDVGISRAEAMREGTRSLLDLPRDRR